MTTKMLAIGNNADGHLEVVAMSGQSDLWHCWELPSTYQTLNFSNWVAFGGPRPRQVVMERNLDGCVEVFVVGWDKNIYHVRQTAPNNGWSVWNVLAQPANYIAVGRNQDGSLEVFALNDTPDLCHLRQATPNHWGLVHPIPGPRLIPQLTPLIQAKDLWTIRVANNQNGRLLVFAGTKSGLVVELGRALPVPGGREPHPRPHELAWHTLVQGGRDFTIGANEDGRLELFWINDQGLVMHRWQTSANGAWGDPAYLGASTSQLGPKAPALLAVAQHEDGRLDLSALDFVENGSVFHICQATPNGDWNAWEGRGLSNRGFIVAGRAQNRTAQLFSIIRDGRADYYPGGNLHELLPDGLMIATPSNLPSAWVDETYSVLLQAGGGAGIRSWSLTAGTLPVGLNLDSGGAIAGTPTAAGARNFTAHCGDQSGQTAEQQFSLLINPARAPAITSQSPLPAATVGQGYTANLQAQGGKAPYAWSVKSGTLPPGLGLNSSTGVVSGSPTTAGVATFTIQCRGANNMSSDKAFLLTTNPHPVTTKTFPVTMASVETTPEGIRLYRGTLGGVGSLQSIFFARQWLYEVVCRLYSDRLPMTQAISLAQGATIGAAELQSLFGSQTPSLPITLTAYLDSEKPGNVINSFLLSLTYTTST